MENRNNTHRVDENRIITLLRCRGKLFVKQIKKKKNYNFTV